jgi:hypothetical protein
MLSDSYFTYRTESYSDWDTTWTVGELRVPFRDGVGIFILSCVHTVCEAYRTCCRVGTGDG